MNLLKPALLSAIFGAAMLCNGAAASERPPRIGEEKILSKKPAQVKPALQAPVKKPVPRRPVRQVLDDDIRPAAPTAGYVPSPPRPPAEVAEGAIHGVPPGPANLNCLGGACIDNNGGRFQGGVGTTLISPQGKLCNHNGLTVQCF